MRKNLRNTAAWRISIWTTLAFGVGTTLAFLLVYFLVEKGIQDRDDTWLKGEVEVLAQVSTSTPKDRLYKRIVGEVAELATREVPEQSNSQGQRLSSAFFLQMDPNNPESLLWVGPNSRDAFINAIQESKLVPGVPHFMRVSGMPERFRAIVRTEDNGRKTYLGVSDRGARSLLQQFIRRSLIVWSGTVLLGFLISYWSARRTLMRVERITETVARIGTGDLQERLPEPENSDEISRLSKTFNVMLNRIQASVNQLRTITDAVAHDLKSPITSLRGILESGLCSPDSEILRDSVGEAIENLDRLLLLLNTTLDLAEAEAGALQLERSPVDLSLAITQLVNLYQPAMVERGHTVAADVEEHVFVDADLQLLNRAISNLLENELRHLPDGREINLTLHSDGGSAILLIEDNGLGFPADIIARACERFVKGKHSPGHGLGLAFVDAVAQAHGGTVSLSNRAGGGAAIMMSLPASVPTFVTGLRR
jgi:signal transduction histidine kinase